MSNNRLVINTAEFIQALRNLPSELNQEAQGVVSSAAEGAKSEIVAAYPEVTGNLKRGVSVKMQKSAAGTVAVVTSRSKHAHWYEFGTQTRQFEGANRGAMPPKPTFVPIVVRRKRDMNGNLINLVRRAGFTVTGDA